MVVGAHSCNAFLTHTAVRSSNAPRPIVRRGNVNMQSSWKGLLDGVMRRTDAQKKGSSSSRVLTAKSRVKLGDLSVSPMGELVVP